MSRRQRVETVPTPRRWCNGIQVRSTTRPTAPRRARTTLPCVRTPGAARPGADAKPGAHGDRDREAEDEQAGTRGGSPAAELAAFGNDNTARSARRRRALWMVTRRGASTTPGEGRAARSPAAEDRRGQAWKKSVRYRPRAPPAPCGARARMTSTRLGPEERGNGDGDGVRRHLGNRREVALTDLLRRDASSSATPSRRAGRRSRRRA